VILFEQHLHYYWTCIFFLLGALFGSFANVVILRLPQNESVVFPSSHCLKCQEKIKPWDNIPILSWFLLKGRCRFCHQAFSFRYPLVEFLTAILFAFSFIKLGWSWTLLEVLVLFFGLTVVSFIDLDHFILPDKFTLPGIVIGILGSLVNPERHFIDSILGVILGGGFLWAIAYIYYLLKKQEGMGGGDIKLMAWIGAVLGWKSIAFVILVSSIVGSLIGLIIIWKNKGNLKTVIPFGPYIAIAVVIYVFWGASIAHWYISIFMPGLDI